MKYEKEDIRSKKEKKNKGKFEKIETDKSFQWEKKINQNKMYLKIMKIILTIIMIIIAIIILINGLKYGLILKLCESLFIFNIFKY